MTQTTASVTEPQDVDVRGIEKPGRHPLIFAAYADLPVGGGFVLINDHDPLHLRDEFEAEHPGSYGWEYLRREPRDWRVRITKLASTPLPRVLVDTSAASAVDDPMAVDATGAIWRLEVRERDLDSNVVAIPAGGSIQAHAGPEVDVLIHVLAGSGTLTTELTTVDLEPGQLLFLPRRSRRQLEAGTHGLRYLTVHQRRQALVIGTSQAEAPR